MAGSLEEIFDRGTNGCSDKWRHYFEIYERYFSKFVGRQCTFLEIGVQKGGSLQIMQEYLGAQAHVLGLDVNPQCAILRKQGLDIHIGDQADPDFLKKFAEEQGPFDIIVDDGGHVADQQIVSFLSLFPYLKNGGIYLVEDLHTTFWLDYQHSRFGINFYDFAKGLVEKMSLWNVDQRLMARYQTPRHLREGAVKINNFALNELLGIHFYDSVIVFEKRRKQEPISEIK